jgi:hypothetical protein
MTVVASIKKSGGNMGDYALERKIYRMGPVRARVTN